MNLNALSVISAGCIIAAFSLLDFTNSRPAFVISATNNIPSLNTSLILVPSCTKAGANLFSIRAFKGGCRKNRIIIYLYEYNLFELYFLLNPESQIKIIIHLNINKN